MPALGPGFVALQARDLHASADFYTERLWLTRAPASPPGAIVFATQPIPFAVREPAVDLDSTDRLGWGVALWFAADDAQSLHDDLVAHGVPIVTPPFDGPFGRTFACTDPDGYTITVHD